MKIISGVLWVAIAMMTLDVVLRAAVVGAIGPILALIPIIFLIIALIRSRTNEED